MGSKTPDMRPASYIRRRGFVARACVVLLLVSALALFFCLGVGSAGYALNNVWQSLAAHLSGGEADATAELVLWRIRLPRSLLAYLVGAALAGGLFLLLADALSRTLFAPAELPVGVTTSLFGGPFFLILIRRYRGGRA